MDKIFDEEKTRIIRLTNGNDIVANCLDGSEENTIVLMSPMLLGGKSGSMFMSPWLPADLLEFNMTIIHASDILCTMIPTSELIDNYNEAVSRLSYYLNYEPSDEEIHQEILKKSVISGTKH